MQHNQGETARLMLDLWQNQLTSMMRDERYVNGMLDMMQKMQEAALHSPFSAWPDSFSGLTDVFSPHSETAAAASAHESGQPGLFARRLSLCEQRLSELESLVSELRQGR